MDLQNEHGFCIQQYPQPMHSSRGLVFPIITAVITFLSPAPVYNKQKENAMPFVIHDNTLKMYYLRRIMRLQFQKVFCSNPFIHTSVDRQALSSFNQW
jgi:hypothetical protein